MKKEIEAASWWWTSQLNLSIAPPLNKDQLMTFHKSLCERMEEKYSGHWYADEPNRGEAFRSIMFEKNIIDNLLLESAHRAKITSLRSRMKTECIMWVDPQTVKIQFSNSGPKKFVIFERGVIEDKNSRAMREYLQQTRESGAASPSKLIDEQFVADASAVHS